MPEAAPRSVDRPSKAISVVAYSDVFPLSAKAVIYFTVELCLLLLVFVGKTAKAAPGAW